MLLFNKHWKKIFSLIEFAIFHFNADATRSRENRNSTRLNLNEKSELNFIIIAMCIVNVACSIINLNQLYISTVSSFYLLVGELLSSIEANVSWLYYVSRLRKKKKLNKTQIEHITFSCIFESIIDKWFFHIKINHFF